MTADRGGQQGSTVARIVAKPLVDGEVLPFPPTPSGSIAGRTMQESVYDPRPAPRRLPPNAPNILIVLIDDAGPGLPTPLGGEVATPTLERVLQEGVGIPPLATQDVCSSVVIFPLAANLHRRIGPGDAANMAVPQHV
jgi:hypothetical protein